MNVVNMEGCFVPNLLFFHFFTIMGKMSKFESCTYQGGLCERREKCLIEGTMLNQMLDRKSWTDPSSERVKQKIAQFIQTAGVSNCLNQDALQTLISRFQAGEPLDQEL